MNNATSGDEDTFVGSYLVYLLAASYEAASARFHAHVRDLGLRVPEWRVLACLQDQDGAMITHLANLALVEQSRLTRIIAKMEHRGLVERRPDSADGRRVRVHLSAEGRRIGASLVEAARKHEADVMACLSPSQGETLKQDLQALLSSLTASEIRR